MKAPFVYVPKLLALPITHTVCVIGKGGSGKTTCTVNLATTAMRLGLKVGILDADPQASCSHWRQWRGVGDVRLKKCESLIDLQKTLQQAVTLKLDLLFIDTPAAIDGMTRDCLALADSALILTRPSSLDANVTIARLDYCAREKIPAHVIINACPARRENLEAGRVRATRQALDPRKGLLWSGQITNYDAIPDAIAAGKGIAEFRPEHTATTEYETLVKAIRNFAAKRQRAT